MVLIIDDILMLPGTIGEIILNSLAQTVQKVAWMEYSRDLKKILLKARYDCDSGKITKEQFNEVESYVFKEMKITKHVLAGNKEA